MSDATWEPTFDSEDANGPIAQVRKIVFVIRMYFLSIIDADINRRNLR